MADFRTHISTSTILGAGYAAAGIAYFQNEPGGTPWASCIVTGGMCSVSGMLPDIDSDSGIPIRETMGFAAAVVPMMLVDRFEQLGLSPQSMVLHGIMIYLAIRFGLSRLIKKFTVHRGMFHSIPAAIIATQIGFLLSCSPNLMIRYYAAGGVFLGFMSHLLLDEWYSIDTSGGRLRLKKSFGTAIKFWGDSAYANFSTWAKVALLTMFVFSDPIIMERYGTPDVVERSSELSKSNYHRIALEGIQKLWR